jgi:hypothetical protein
MMIHVIKHLTKMIFWTLCIVGIVMLLPYVFKSEAPMKTYRSKDKNLVVGLGKECSTVETTGVFFFKKEDLHGKLTDIECFSSRNSSQVEYKFFASENERCSGKMTMIKSPQKTVMIWKTEGSISASQCFPIGKYLEVEIKE